MKVDIVNNSNTSFQANWVKNKKYMLACKEAYLRYMENEIPEGEKLLSTFPDHKLKLENTGIRNLTTKKFHKFPFLNGENSHFEDLMHFYSLLKQQGNTYIQELFK